MSSPSHPSLPRFACSLTACANLKCHAHTHTLTRTHTHAHTPHTSRLHYGFHISGACICLLFLWIFCKHLCCAICLSVCLSVSLSLFVLFFFFSFCCDLSFFRSFPLSIPLSVSCIYVLSLSLSLSLFLSLFLFVFFSFYFSLPFSFFLSFFLSFFVIYFCWFVFLSVLSSLSFYFLSFSLLYCSSSVSFSSFLFLSFFFFLSLSFFLSCIFSFFFCFCYLFLSGLSFLFYLPLFFSLLYFSVCIVPFLFSIFPPSFLSFFLSFLPPPPSFSSSPSSSVIFKEVNTCNPATITGTLSRISLDDEDDPKLAAHQEGVNFSSLPGNIPPPNLLVQVPPLGPLNELNEQPLKKEVNVEQGGQQQRQRSAPVYLCTESGLGWARPPPNASEPVGGGGGVAGEGDYMVLPRRTVSLKPPPPPPQDEGKPLNITVEDPPFPPPPSPLTLHPAESEAYPADFATVDHISMNLNRSYGTLKQLPAHANTHNTLQVKQGRPSVRHILTSGTVERTRTLPRNIGSTNTSLSAGSLERKRVRYSELDFEVRSRPPPLSPAQCLCFCVLLAGGLIDA
uniref:Uncharacterized protein n=1 Tax=Astyanax mexicanus TaxID=7994 RepID=A0A3B1KGI1_ASTMX